MTRRKTQPRDERGFSVVELGIALAVFSILTLIAIPRFATFQQSLTTKALARNVGANLRFAQQKAVTANRPCYVELDVAKSFLAIWLDKNLNRTFEATEVVQPVGFPDVEAEGGIQGVRFPAGTVIESTTFPNGIRAVPAVAFSSDGGVRSPGEIVLRDADGRRYKLTITLAGGMSVFQYVGGSWVE